MKKCKQSQDSECGKNICCFECEERGSCNTKCGKESPEGCDQLIDDTESVALEKFKTEQADLITQIANFKKASDEMEKQKKDLHDKLEKTMELYGVKSITTDNIRITYIAPHTQSKFNTDAFKKDHADLYEIYKKTSNVKASVKIEDPNARKAVRE